ncbi:hypothetical protein [Ranid herpesvirus 3]|uniref:Sulfotransferase domain-containing protein n=1 Tax=Ranid herpesvirus 3 TaxID=1987509 RepID=A0A1X9T579_9VIRU|nr:hypothetical protein [Ranid herpesvirus 3]ARR28858.1 hypothetical protein [Ranid herpesvirus 3]
MTEGTIWYEGVAFPKHYHTTYSIKSATEFVFRNSDIVIASYPRSAAKWVATVIAAFLYPSSKLRWLQAPFLEYVYFDHEMNNQREVPRRIIMTHMLPTRLKKAILKSKCVIFYVQRKADEVFLSYYNCHLNTSYLPSLSFTEFERRFFSGELCYGHYYTHRFEWGLAMKEFNGHGRMISPKTIHQIVEVMGGDELALDEALRTYPFANHTVGTINSLNPEILKRLYDCEVSLVTEQFRELCINCSDDIITPYQRSILCRNARELSIRLAKYASQLEHLLITRSVLSSEQCLAARFNAKPINRVFVLLEALKNCKGENVIKGAEECIKCLIPEVVQEMKVLENPGCKRIYK